jgi:uncharacterized protein YbdZ (MbtH family)
MSRSTAYLVVIDHEGHYAVWRADRSLPDGWTGTDLTGSREECLAYVKLMGEENIDQDVVSRLTLNTPD